MYYQLYVDSLLIQELIINFYVLELCRLCLMSTATRKRLFFAALFAGIYQVIMLCISYPENMILFYLILIILYMFGSFVTVVIAFGKTGWRSILKRTVLYMTILLMTGGILMGIFPRITAYKRSKAKVLWFFFFGALTYFLLLNVLKNRRQRTYFGKLIVSHQGKKLEGNFFWDSGNSLTESLSGKPVLLADAKWLFGSFEKEALMCRPVVYQSVGKQKGILFAYCLDELVIYGETKTYTYEKVWIGVCREELFNNKEYQVILPLDYGFMYE